MNSAVNRYNLPCHTSSLRCRAEEKPINSMSDEPDIDTLGIKALKELITGAGLSVEDCLDKADLRARAREALAAKKAAPVPAASSAASTTMKEEVIGTYQSIIKGPADLLNGTGEPADLVIIALHGLGASNRDLVDVPSTLGSYESGIAKARMIEVFPQAPMGAMGAAWWSFDAMQFMQVQMTPPGPQREQLVAALIRRKFDGLDACRTNMRAVVERARALGGGASGTPLPMSRVVLAGFSLGSMTALDLALTYEEGESVAGVLVMNGAPICVDEWAARLPKHKGLKVHLTHGMSDQMMPFEACGWTKQLLDAYGAVVEQSVHPGGHDIGGPDVLRKIARWMVQLLPAR